MWCSRTCFLLAYELIPLNMEVYQTPPPTWLSSYAMGKLLAQHLQDIISMLFYILLLESQELKADIFPFHDLKTFINLITLVFLWFPLVAINSHLFPPVISMNIKNVYILILIKLRQRHSVFNVYLFTITRLSDSFCQWFLWHCRLS